MNLFINNIVLHVVREKDPLSIAHFDGLFLQCPEMDLLSSLEGTVLVQNADDALEEIMVMAQKNTSMRALTIVLQVKAYRSAKSTIKSMFKIIKAAGGVVERGDEVLMIFRLGKWDLPKGKLEKGESMKTAAVREVEEECSVEVVLQKKITTTWHHYTFGGKAILKKTKWYLMTLVNDGEMQPQREEDIEEVRWMSPKKVTEAMGNSYLSIEFVVEQYKTLKHRP